MEKEANTQNPKLIHICPHKVDNWAIRDKSFYERVAQGSLVAYRVVAPNNPIDIMVFISPLDGDRHDLSSEAAQFILDGVRDIKNTSDVMFNSKGNEVIGDILSADDARATVDEISWVERQMGSHAIHDYD